MSTTTAIPTLQVSSIFDSIDGEVNGWFGAGELSSFIRLAGCNLNCTWCDTVYAQRLDSGKEMTIIEIMQQIHFKKVTLTGGEPLLQPSAVNLIASLIESDHFVTIETNGSIGLVYLTRALAPFAQTHLQPRFIVDYKLPSSHEEAKMIPEAFNILRYLDVIKFVIATEEDYKRALTIVYLHENDWQARFAFSPLMSRRDSSYISPEDLATRIIENGNERIHFNLQIHKVLWANKPEREEH